jgi:hypothetical protein
MVLDHVFLLLAFNNFSKGELPENLSAVKNALKSDVGDEVIREHFMELKNLVHGIYGLVHDNQTYEALSNAQKAYFRQNDGITALDCDKACDVLMAVFIFN